MKQAVADLKQREILLDFYRSCSMLFVFYHHTITVFPNWVDLFRLFNPFAEIFVLISGFMVGMVYLHRESYSEAILDRAKRIFAAYFVIALPVAVGAALIGQKQEPVLGAIFSVLTFRSDPTAIGILKFYGFMFLLLPIILPLYKRNARATLLVSAITFAAATSFVHTLPQSPQDPLLSLLMVLPQWQFFFMIGIAMGDLHRSRRLIGLRFYASAILIFVIGLIVDFHLGFPYGEKWPYTFQKLINLLWTLPLVLAILYVLYTRIKDSPHINIILNVGRNSLIAFLLSEIVRQSVKLFTVIFHLQPPIYIQHMIGLFGVLLVTFLLWLYLSQGRGKLSVLLPLAGR